MMRLFYLTPNGVGGNLIEESTRLLHTRVGEIIASSNLGDTVLTNSLRFTTITCQVFLVCTYPAITKIHSQLKDIYSIGHVSISRGQLLSDAEIQHFSTPADEPTKPEPRRPLDVLSSKINKNLYPHFGKCGDPRHQQSPTTHPICVVVIISVLQTNEELLYRQKLAVPDDKVYTSLGYRFFNVSITTDQIVELAEQPWVSEIYEPWQGPHWG